MKNHRKSKLFYRVIDTWIDIDARPEVVWEALLDFPSWNSWNPFIPEAQGILEENNFMRIKVIPPGMKPMNFKSKVYKVKECEEILWGGSFLGFIYKGDHAFLLEALENGMTRFRQIERFNGPIVLFMGGMIIKTEEGYHIMNEGLKNYIESKDDGAVLHSVG